MARASYLVIIYFNPRTLPSKTMMVSRRANGRAVKQRQVKPVKNNLVKLCVRNPTRPPICNNKNNRKNCTQCKDFQKIRRKPGNRRSARESRIKRSDKREALAATIESNQITLAQAGATLEWELAGKAAYQVQVEEMLKLMANLKALRHQDNKL